MDVLLQNLITKSVDPDNLDSLIESINKKIITLKKEMNSVMQESPIKFISVSSNSEELITKIQTLNESMDNILVQIETQVKPDLQNSTSELQSLSNKLQESNLILSILGELISLDSKLKSAIDEQKNKNYVVASEILKDIHSQLKNPTNSELKELEVYKSLKNERTIIYEQFMYDMTEIWKSFLKTDESTVQDSLRQSLIINTSRLSEFDNTIQALQIFDYLELLMKRFSTNLFNNFLRPLILNDSRLSVVDEEETSTLMIEIKLNSEAKSDYEVVMDNIKIVLQFINRNLNFVLNGDVKFIEKIGEMISDEFSECLIKNCLSETIPTHSNELVQFVDVIKTTEEFEDYLKDIGFLKDSNESIIKYAKNIDVLFANKTCQNILDRARKIMKKDLHNTVQVGKIVPSYALPFTLNEFSDLSPSDILSCDTFQFPQCMVSSSCQELLDLVHEVLEEAVQSSDFCSVRLFYTARNIFELYIAVVPLYHKEMLAAIPQQVALLHNNCMYLAHRLLTLDHEYQDRFPSVLNKRTTTFVDLVTKLRELGTNVFFSHIRNQRNLILDILRSSGLITICENPQLSLNAEKAIRQSIRQLELLKAVWQNVLPVNVYCSTIGCLLNAFVEELIIQVCHIEDIPASTATDLTSVFCIVKERAPQVMQDPKEIYRYVERWQKFQELIILLSASLKEIEERWADGMGPLAVAFDNNEIKQMIRALFQNTERRTAVLSRIK